MYMYLNSWCATRLYLTHILSEIGAIMIIITQALCDS